ncbi:hypothetical protein HFN51_04395 [Rhizobium leguminosarum]|nr:hypothetical protein [Rhizobium leguminosarum]
MNDDFINPGEVVKRPSFEADIKATNLSTYYTITAANAQIEARALAWANDRVNLLAYRKVSPNSFTIPDNGLMMCPAGAVFTGMNMQGTQNNPAMTYHYLQAYDPVRGWVTFSGS